MVEREMNVLVSVTPNRACCRLPARAGLTITLGQEFYLAGNPRIQNHFPALEFPALERYGVVRETCLEGGCGAERMTRRLP